MPNQHIVNKCISMVDQSIEIWVMLFDWLTLRLNVVLLTKEVEWVDQSIEIWAMLFDWLTLRLNVVLLTEEVEWLINLLKFGPCLLIG